MNTPLEDFLQRSAAASIYHTTNESAPDDAFDLDAWGNEWETGYDNEDYY